MLRAEILDAAEGLLVATGDESALSIRAIAKAVGVTPPSIYLHFADRNELIFAVVEEQFRQLDRQMQQAVEGVDDPMARIARRGQAYVDFGLANPEHYRLLMMGRPDCTPDRFVDERLGTTATFEHVVEDVQAAIAAGQLPFGDPVLVSCGLWMVVHGVTSLLITKPEFPWPDRATLMEHVLTVYRVGLASS
ncbi:MAG TPA: TetR/AcrR family transcriptional regulator [Acidimicrobiales bacterium]|nr:TetR/AcrR family transcriptional regulator [Acidimicrobiales bacterium]